MKPGRDVEFGDAQGIGIIKVFVNSLLLAINNFGPYYYRACMFV